MRRKPWTDEELAFIRNNYKRMTFDEIGRRLGRSPETVNNQARKMGLYKMRRGPWSEEEINYLTEHHVSKTYRDIGVELGRSEESVRSMVKALGLQKREKRKREQQPKRAANVTDRRRLEALRQELSRRMDICAACVAEWGVPPGFDGFDYRHKLERQRCPRCAINRETREIVEEMEAIQRAIRVERERERAKTRDRRLSGE